MKALPEDGTRYGGREQTMSANSDRLQALINRCASGMETAERSDLSDIVAVQKVAASYFKECGKNATVPTVSGLAGKLGCTRQNLYDYGKRNRDFHAFLEDYSDKCGELLAEAALDFVLKSRYQWRECPAQLELVRPKSILDDGITAEDIARKYRELPE